MRRSLGLRTGDEGVRVEDTSCARSVEPLITMMLRKQRNTRGGGSHGDER
jgi:hypothetical protein